MENPAAKFCLVCHQKNVVEATNCAYCGASLDIEDELRKITEKMPSKTVSFPTIEKRLEALKGKAAQVKGVAIYVAGIMDAVAVMNEDEFILGRQTEDTLETLVDLTPFGASVLGVSRRHAMIHKASSQYEITDLTSTNGTWLNNQRLVPNRPYPVFSGVPIRLGHLYIFLIMKTADS